MSKAIVCDKCGAIIERSIDWDRRFYEHKVDAPSWRLEFTVNGEDCNDTTSPDLCPQCFTSLVRWFKELVVDGKHIGEGPDIASR